MTSLLKCNKKSLVISVLTIFAILATCFTLCACSNQEEKPIDNVR